MACFAQLDENNIVIQVISVHNNEVPNEEAGITFCKSLYGQNTIWKQGSYNTKGGIYYNPDGTFASDQSKAFRKNHPSIESTYDEVRDAFIPKKTSTNRVFDEFSCTWRPNEATKPPKESLPEGAIDWMWSDKNNGEWIPLP